jgi:hypothetical protein
VPPGRAGKSAQILLRYQAGDWNALHRDVFGDLVFPLQVVVGLDEYGTDYTGGEFLLVEAAEGAVPGHLRRPGAGPRPDLHHQGPAGAQRARLVCGLGPARRKHRALRPPACPRPGLARRLNPGVSRGEACVSCLRGWPGAGDLLGLDPLGRGMCLSVSV